ncbi:MAG TPA: M48 family metalloprotease [Pyrinomonadaceae bacterium]|nr:M48 family metalloprotease [Pyrinomonadaceae bacterium]
MLKTISPYRFLLLFASLLLLITPVQLQAQEQNRALLAVHINSDGAASVSLGIRVDVQDQEPIKRALTESFSFPIVFRELPAEWFGDLNEGATEESSETYTLIAARTPQVFSGGRLKKTCQINLQTLLPQLRQHHIDHLRVMVFLQTGSRDVPIQGLERLSNEFVNFYHYEAEIDVRAGTFPVINFAIGYGAGDLLKKTLPLLVFLLLPALGTILSARRSSANPEELWGKHLRFVNRLLNVVWIVWLPVYFFSGVSDIISFVSGADLRDLGSVGQAVNIAFYFIPPVIAMFLCHLASGRVYEQLRSVEWSPRQVVRQAVIANAISLIPMFLVIVGMYAFSRSPRQAALYAIIGYIGFILLSQNMGRLLGSRLHALTSGDLRDRIFDLAHRAGVQLQQVYVLPETSAQLSNAFARSDNSVMITNSLLKNLSRREVDGIMAHEIGHLQAKHPQGSGTIMVVAIVVANLAGTFITKLLNLENATPLVFAGAIGVAQLVVFFRSRRNERQADAIGISLTGDPEAFISGLARLSRLNLMPLHSGGWGESLDTHPGTMGRFREIATAHGIPESRLQELVTNVETPADRYPPIDDEVDTTVFSTEFKNKYRLRVTLLVLAVLLLSPVPFAVALARDGVSPLRMLGLAIAGLIWSFLISMVVRDRLTFWGYSSVGRRLRMKLDKRGLVDLARHGTLVGLAPAAESRKYEGYPFWDVGVLWLTKEKLYYIGEQCEFALEREQVSEVYSRDTVPEWVAEKSLFIRWKDFAEGPKNTVHFVSTGEVTVTKARRAIDDLQKRVQAWVQQSEDFPTASPVLASVGSPVFPEITCSLALMKFNAGLVFKAALQLFGFATIVGFAIRLSYTSILYMAVAAFLLTFIDELSRTLKDKHRITQIIPVPASFESGTYQRGSWKNA